MRLCVRFLIYIIKSDNGRPVVYITPSVLHHRLKNYLRAYRKRSGLSQKEIAYLLGSQSGTKVSRYERLARQPSIETVFAYKVIFGANARDLFAGMFQKVEQATRKRARLLAKKISVRTKSRLNARKLEALTALADGPRP